MRAGKLRFYGQIEREEVTGTGTHGEPLKRWLPVYHDVAMDIDPLAGKQVEIARQLVATASHKIALRWAEGVEAGMRVVLEGRRFVIGYVDDGDFRDRDMYLITTEQRTGAE